jgi:hypothetical protein
MYTDNPYAQPYVAPIAPPMDEPAVRQAVQDDSSRKKVIKVVAAVFITLAAIALASCLLVGAVLAPIAFVGVLIALPVLVVASIAIAAARGAKIGRMRFNRQHHGAGRVQMPGMGYGLHPHSHVPAPTAPAVVLPTGQQIPATRAHHAPAPAMAAKRGGDAAVLPTGQQVPGTRPGGRRRPNWN